MSEIPENVIEAGIEAWAEYSDGHSRDTFTGEGLVTAILKKAEEAWPHETPGRDITGTTASSTERSYRSDGYRRLAFGFGPPGVRA